MKPRAFHIARIIAVCGVTGLMPPIHVGRTDSKPAVTVPQPTHMAHDPRHELTGTSPAIPQQYPEEMASSPAPLREGLTFGSQVILTGLWSTQDLEGHPGDQRRVRTKIPGQAEPLHLIPPGGTPLLAPAWRNSIRSVTLAPHHKVVALTFDLCERADEVTGYDAPLVNVLRAMQVRATFFAGGKWMQSHPEQTMQLMADPLFELGNHTWTHGNLRVLKGQRMEQQILSTQAQYALLWEELKHRAVQHGIDPQELAKIPDRPRLFRFPYGTCSPEALQTLATWGLPAIQWDVVSGDPASRQTADEIVRTVLHDTTPGSIVVFHANGRGHGTAGALPRLILALRARGFEFATVSELLRLGIPVTTDECYERSPGDNRRYDKLFGEGTGS
jgi:peptidoglycan/xylan/chitin deacetylase (PgdA/CDA1 family)